MTRFIIVIVLFAVMAAAVAAFRPTSGFARSGAVTRSSQGLKMEYIPDGFSKKQWEELKAKEAADKKKNLGALGVGKFKSRSFEAWQKSGGKHLFPVDPNNSKYEERPYMQRRGGDWEGKDLKDRGLKGFGQGQAYERLDLDEMYEDAAKAGKLNSVSIFGGASLPWTNNDANKMDNSKEKSLNFQRGTAGKKLSQAELNALKQSLVKPIVTKNAVKEDAVAAEVAPKKKGLFGLF